MVKAIHKIIMSVYDTVSAVLVLGSVWLAGMYSLGYFKVLHFSDFTWIITLRGFH